MYLHLRTSDYSTVLSGLLNISAPLHNHLNNIFSRRQETVNEDGLCSVKWAAPSDIFPLYFLKRLSVTLYFRPLSGGMDDFTCLRTSATEWRVFSEGSKSFHLATFPFPGHFISSWLSKECISHMSTDQWHLFVSLSLALVPKDKNKGQMAYILSDLYPGLGNSFSSNIHTPENKSTKPPQGSHIMGNQTGLTHYESTANVFLNISYHKYWENNSLDSVRLTSRDWEK